MVSTVVQTKCEAHRSIDIRARFDGGNNAALGRAPSTASSYAVHRGQERSEMRGFGLIVGIDGIKQFLVRIYVY